MNKRRRKKALSLDTKRAEFLRHLVVLTPKMHTLAHSLSGLASSMLNLRDSVPPMYRRRRPIPLQGLEPSVVIVDELQTWREEKVPVFVGLDLATSPDSTAWHVIRDRIINGTPAPGKTPIGLLGSHRPHD